MPRYRATLLASCLAACLLGCRRPAPPGPPPAWFDDVTDARGIDFTHDAGPIDPDAHGPSADGGRRHADVRLALDPGPALAEPTLSRLPARRRSRLRRATGDARFPYNPGP